MQEAEYDQLMSVPRTLIGGLAKGVSRFVNSVAFPAALSGY